MNKATARLKVLVEFADVPSDNDVAGTLEDIAELIRAEDTRGEGFTPEDEIHYTWVEE